MGEIHDPKRDHATLSSRLMVAGTVAAWRRDVATSVRRRDVATSVRRRGVATSVRWDVVTSVRRRDVAASVRRRDVAVSVRRMNRGSLRLVFEEIMARLVVDNWVIHNWDHTRLMRVRV